MTKEEIRKRNEKILKIRFIRKKRRRIKRMVRLTTFVFLMLFSFMCLKLIATLLDYNKKPPEFILSSTKTKTVSADNYEILENINEDNKWTADLKELSIDKSKINQIIYNINEYPDNIMELLINNPETIDFVLNYPELEGVHNSPDSIDITGSYIEGKIPLFLQWDTRWGYNQFGEEGNIALNGCGPTCLSMVMVGLTGDLSWNPIKMAEYCVEEGYLAGNKTSWALMTTGAQNMGLNSRELPLDETAVSNELINGNPIICSMGPGEFTKEGHFIVLYGYQNGKILLNDPNSIERSKLEWDFADIQSQVKNLWVFSN